MLPELGRIGPLVLRSYSVMLDAAILAGLGMLAYRGWKVEGKPTRWLDAGLVALVAGVIGARAEHVLIHFDYFAEHPLEIAQVWLGGLEWHLAVALGLAGLALGCRRKDVSFRDAIDALAPILSAGAGLAYGGCWLSACGYGREVPSLADTPRFISAELPDIYGTVAPRLNSQVFGVAASLILLGVALILAWRLQHKGVRLWIVLALLSGAAFAINATVGDPAPMVGPLRLDQCFDLAMMVIGLAGTVLSLRGLRQVRQGTG